MFAADASGPCAARAAPDVAAPVPRRVLSGVAPVILAGGLGTRLRAALPDCPKVLAPVFGRPFITFLLDQLVAASAREVILLTGHGAAQVRDALGENYRGMSLLYSTEAQPLGTAGALRAALPSIQDPTILLMNGDSYCAVALSFFLEFHRDRGADASLVLKRVEQSERFGQVMSLPCGRITRFREKQPGGGSAWINAGVYLIQRDLFESIPAQESVSLEQSLLPRWVESKIVCGYRSPGRFLDIGTPASYELAAPFFSHLGMDSPAPIDFAAGTACREQERT